jgi:hypothetical protein
VPQAPATAVVISVIRCDSSVSVDVSAGKLPSTTLYHDDRSFSGSPPDTASWALQQIRTGQLMIARRCLGCRQGHAVNRMSG